jgi:signal transduction histidine kinase/ActR/RegA family two-component response regulator
VSERSCDVDRRVLVLAATGRDAELTREVLSPTNLAVTDCETFDAMVAEVSAGAAVALIAEERLSSDRTMLLSRVLGQQPAWSDLPMLILTRPGADSAAVGEAVTALGNVTLLERPLRVGTLLTAVRSAMRARERQYEIRRHLAERARSEALLRDADRRKDEFLATLGHELRNPLAPLLTGLQLLKAAAPHDPAVPRVSAVMERQVAHLTRLVDDLLELSRITQGVIHVKRVPIVLGSAVRSAIETVRPAIEAAGQELIVEEPASDVTVEGDAVRLTQVFANLLGNAAKYTEPGGHIWLTTRREQDRAVVSIRDDGIGIAPEQLQSIFEMFTQLDRSNRRSQGGLGIGLTLVRSLVTMHGGRVEARSAGVGHGSEFVVELPARSETAVEDRRTDAVGRFPPARILIVDDNADAAEMLGQLLELMGATVATAHTGARALELLPAFRPDALLLDIGMPAMDGYEVARRVRATTGHAGVLLIALTGWGQVHDQQLSRAAGFDYHMVKPLDLDELHEVLSAWPERRHAPLRAKSRRIAADDPP